LGAKASEGGTGGKNDGDEPAGETETKHWSVERRTAPRGVKP
jgi:hypothetical protein